jgi:hypothetical protein
MQWNKASDPPKDLDPEEPILLWDDYFWLGTYKDGTYYCEHGSTLKTVKHWAYLEPPYR